MTYETDIISETLAGPPFLLDGETIQFTGKQGISPFGIIAGVVGFFIPPFLVWGLATFSMLWWLRKSNGSWITDRRCLASTILTAESSNCRQSEV